MALQDISANLNLTAQRLGAGDLDALMLEMFNNVVREKTQFASITDGVFPRTPLIGTDTMSNAAHTDPVLQAVVAGIEPAGKTTLQGDRIVQVKVPIIARVTEGMLSRVQDRLNIYGRMPRSFARILSKAIDEIQLHKCVQSAMETTGAGKLAGLASGVDKSFTLADDEADADKLEAMFRSIQVAKMRDEVDVNEGFFYVTPEIYNTLTENDRLMSSLFSGGNGSVADWMVTKVGNFRIKPTNRLPEAVNAAHTMGTAYNIDAEEAKTLAVWATEEAIMSAEAISQTSDAYWDKRLLTWFIDSYLCFGTGIDNPAYAAVIRKA